jgi:hypothetical protein
MNQPEHDRQSFRATWQQAGGDRTGSPPARNRQASASPEFRRQSAPSIDGGEASQNDRAMGGSGRRGGGREHRGGGAGGRRTQSTVDRPQQQQQQHWNGRRNGQQQQQPRQKSDVNWRSQGPRAVPAGEVSVAVTNAGGATQQPTNAGGRGVSSRGNQHAPGGNAVAAAAAPENPWKQARGAGRQSEQRERRAQVGGAPEAAPVPGGGGGVGGGSRGTQGRAEAAPAQVVAGSHADQLTNTDFEAERQRFRSTWARNHAGDGMASGSSSAAGGNARAAPAATAATSADATQRGGAPGQFFGATADVSLVEQERQRFRSQWASTQVEGNGNGVSRGSTVAGQTGRHDMPQQAQAPPPAVQNRQEIRRPSAAETPAMLNALFAKAAGGGHTQQQQQQQQQHQHMHAHPHQQQSHHHQMPQPVAHPGGMPSQQPMHQQHGAPFPFPNAGAPMPLRYGPGTNSPPFQAPPPPYQQQQQPQPHYYGYPSQGPQPPQPPAWQQMTNQQPLPYAPPPTRAIGAGGPLPHEQRQLAGQQPRQQQRSSPPAPMSYSQVLNNNAGQS